MSVPDFAIPDFNIGDYTSAIIADELLAAGIRFVFAIGYGDALMIPSRCDMVPVLRKPIGAAMLLEAFGGPDQL